MYNYKEDELISALHKCIRAGDIARSALFAKIIKENIGVWRVKQYLFYIVLEETISIDLYIDGMELFLKDDDDITDIDIYTFIYQFCLTSKKWDTNQGQLLTLRHMNTDLRFKNTIVNKDVFFENMLSEDINFKKLNSYIEKLKENDKIYSKSLNRWKVSNYINIAHLFYLIDESITTKNNSNLLLCSYLCYYNRDIIEFSLLEDFFKENKLYKAMKKLNGKHNYLFSYVVLFDSLLNPINDIYYVNKKDVDVDFIKKLSDRIDVLLKDMLLEKRPYFPIPLYAHDRHTRKGKDLLTFMTIKFNDSINKNVDLRFSGNWYAVLWRIESVKQYNKIVKKDSWKDVYINNYQEQFILNLDKVNKVYKFILERDKGDFRKKHPDTI